MAVLAFKEFRGEVPRRSYRAVPANYAKVAYNVRLDSGALRPLNRPSPVQGSFYAGAKTALRHTVGDGSVRYWLSFASYVDFVQAPVANDEYSRGVFTSEDHEPRVVVHPQSFVSAPYPSTVFALGVPAPQTAPTVSVTGGSGAQETRSYVYTVVDAFGCESAPSPPQTATGYVDGTWSIQTPTSVAWNGGAITSAIMSGGYVRLTLASGHGLEPGDVVVLTGVPGVTRTRVARVSGNDVFVYGALSGSFVSGTWQRESPYAVTGAKKRVYRSAGTDADYLFVAEIPLSTASVNDTVTAAQLGEVVPTKTWTLPPKFLRGLTSTAYGSLAAISGRNEVCFSEPYVIYAWPIEYRYTTSSDVVALVASGAAVVALTTDMPVAFAGAHPAELVQSTIDTYAPCVAAASVVSTPIGAMYASHDGIWVVNAAAAQNVTKNLFTVDEWRRYNPSSFRAAFFDMKYIASFDGEERSGTIILDAMQPDSVVFVEDAFERFYVDKLQNALYGIKDGQVFRLFSSIDHYFSQWVSADVQIDRPSPFACAQVHLDVEAQESDASGNQQLLATLGDGAVGAVASASILETELAPAQLDVSPPPPQVQFTLYERGVPVYSCSVRSSTPFRLPAGLYEVPSVGLIANTSVHSVVIASSMSELSGAKL